MPHLSPGDPIYLALAVAGSPLPDVDLLQIGTAMTAGR
jgi:hypothetical protein